jgi:UDP-N-acetylmuramate dehydrogenase
MKITENESLAKHTVFKIGGPARHFIEPQSHEEIREAIQFAKKAGEPWVILGAGSNVLVSDEGFPGTVIHPKNGMVRVTDSSITVDAGVPMARVVAEALAHDLRGFEWAIGVPGTLGGSIVGNAGCFGGEIKDVVESVEIFNSETEETKTMSNVECRFGYRDSMFKHEGRQLVIFSAAIRLKKGERAPGQELVKQYTAARFAEQDIGAQCAGCAFKNIGWERVREGHTVFKERFPEAKESAAIPGIATGSLVDALGLKGYAVGGAKISERHGNFIVNTGNATAKDVRAVIEHVKKEVRDHYHIELEEELRYIGFE